MDEKTPHIHATIVPIVTGERRKVKNKTEIVIEKYKKKNPNSNRLCADDVMARNQLKHYQNTYAMAMAKYGLKEGLKVLKQNIFLQLNTTELFIFKINNSNRKRT
jgi:hypothetical protein